MKNRTYNIVAIALIATLTLLCSACTISVEKVDSSNTIEKTFNVTEFRGIEANSGINVIYKIADEPSVKVTASENCMKKLNVFVDKKGVLHLTCDERGKDNQSVVINFSKNSNITAYVSGPSLSSVKIYGSGEFECNDSMQTENMLILVSGSGEVDMNSVEATNLGIQIQGSGDVELKNAFTENANLTITGSGDINSRLIKTNKTNVHIAGSGDVELDFADCNTASVEIAGSGDIKLSGSLRNLEKDIAGSGEIDTKNLKLTK